MTRPARDTKPDAWTIEASARRRGPMNPRPTSSPTVSMIASPPPGDDDGARDLHDADLRTSAVHAGARHRHGAATTRSREQMHSTRSKDHSAPSPSIPRRTDRQHAQPTTASQQIAPIRPIMRRRAGAQDGPSASTGGSSRHPDCFSPATTRTAQPTAPPRAATDRPARRLSRPPAARGEGRDRERPHQRPRRDDRDWAIEPTAAPAARGRGRAAWTTSAVTAPITLSVPMTRAPGPPERTARGTPQSPATVSAICPSSQARSLVATKRRTALRTPGCHSARIERISPPLVARVTWTRA